MTPHSSHTGEQTPPTQASEAAVQMLIVEDDPNVGEAMENFFRNHGYAVTRAPDGQTALELLREHPDFDIVTLDVMLPDMDGFDVLEASQEMGIATPILMVTARGEHEDVLRGLGLGAREYIVKPFNPDALVERIETILGRTEEADELPTVLHLGDVQINFANRHILRNDQEIHLDEQAFDLLRTLARNRGAVISRKRLLREAWGFETDHISFTISPDVVAHTLEQHIEKIRLAIEPTPSEPTYLETLIGLGYRLND